MPAALPAGQVRLLHELSGQVPSHLELLGFQALRNHPRARTSPAFDVQLNDFFSEPVALGIRCRTAAKPVIKRAAGNAQRTAKQAGRIQA